MIFKKWSLQKVLPYLLIIIGIIGYAAAFIIMYEKISLANNPGYTPSCNLNPVISCGSIMKSDQATAFGFPNPFIGLGAFPVVAFVGVGILAGAKFKRWYWLGLNIGFVFALAFVHWLFFQSVYRIGALCPYCIAAWVVTITGFWYITLYNIDSKFINLPKGKPKAIYKWVRKHHLDLLILWFLIIFGLILKRFWYYYGSGF